MPTYKTWIWVCTPLLALGAYFLALASFSAEAALALAVATWMLFWWITEPVPLFVTALLPIAVFPALGLMPLSQTCANYGNSVIFLFMGGFMLALALEKWRLHRRIALGIVYLTGTETNRVVLGFMLATAFLSMWISNTATAVMMLPIADSVVRIFGQQATAQQQIGIRRFALSLMLGIAIAANVGGIATVIGTPPNTVMVGYAAQKLQYNVDFGRWLLMALPFSALVLYAAYFLLVSVLFPNGLPKFDHAAAYFRQELQALGALQGGERRTLWVFAATASAWVLRGYLPWHITDTEIAIVATVVLFVVPAGAKAENPSETLLRWSDTERLPWGILLLFGGGIALAELLGQKGLIQRIGDALVLGEQGGALLPWLLLLVIVVSIYLTEVMSNVALVVVLLPVLEGLSRAMNLPPLLLMIPATMASSCAFMLPMATPPNAIVFAGGYIKVREMVRAGFWLNLLALGLLWLWAMFWIPLLFG
ncbi:SLC13 family permease [Eisenibacter elegans]|uniref:SLC13 family permease n=1 Tax=Eisenibacter elegans TaxID=997 RepID=UPI000404421E|nr:DASS family sodium-coupled anion symporter [Eisenibacter elegans]